MDLSQYDTNDNGIKILSRKQLSGIGMDVLSEYMPKVLKEPCAVDIEKLIEDEFALDIKAKSIYRDDNPVIGMCAFFDGKVEIPSNDPNGRSEVIELYEGNIVVEESLFRLKMYHRLRNTMAHELAHWILHRGYFSPDKGEYSFRKVVACRESVVNGERKMGNRLSSDNDWLEFQANCLGAALLMPQEPFKRAFKEECLDNHIGSDYIISGKDPMAEYLIERSLMNVFKVSKKSAHIRLKELGLLVYGEEEVV